MFELHGCIPAICNVCRACSPCLNFRVWLTLGAWLLVFVLQAACGGPNAPLSFEGAAWNSSTVAVIAAAKAHTEMVLLQVRTKGWQ